MIAYTSQDQDIFYMRFQMLLDDGINNFNMHQRVLTKLKLQIISYSDCRNMKTTIFIFRQLIKHNILLIKHIIYFKT